MCFAGLLKTFSQSTKEIAGMGDEGDMNARGLCQIINYESVLRNKGKSQSELSDDSGV